jgi:hypothetical protein
LHPQKGSGIRALEQPIRFERQEGNRYRFWASPGRLRSYQRKASSMSAAAAGRTKTGITAGGCGCAGRVLAEFRPGDSAWALAIELIEPSIHGTSTSKSDALIFSCDQCPTNSY